MKNELSNVINVLIVDDSPVVCKVINEILNSDPQIIVTGIVTNGKEAVKYACLIKPDVITMDINMPVMDGLEATKLIMSECPTPIIIVSSAVSKKGLNRTFEAISCGAVDVFDKSDINIEAGQLLIDKVKQLCGACVVRHPLTYYNKRLENKIDKITGKNITNYIIAIASSTGGPLALVIILKLLPKNIPCSVVIVQHISSGFENGLAEWLDNECALKVKVAQDCENLENGTVYISPCDFQMEVDKNKRVFLSKRPSENDFMPSCDILLSSVAEIYKDKAIGVILTGMGKDGSLGIKAIKDKNGHTIAQDEKSCIVFGMSKTAIELDVVDKISPLEDIADNILDIIIKG